MVYFHLIKHYDDYLLLSFVYDIMIEMFRFNIIEIYALMCSRIISYLGRILFYEDHSGSITGLKVITRLRSFNLMLGYAMILSPQLLLNLCVKMDSKRIDHAFCLYVKSGLVTSSFELLA